jgi:hypothetical protein
MHKTIAAPVLLAVLFAALAGQALAATNYSGVWKLDVSKSDFGPAPTPEFMTRTITHRDPMLEIKTHQKGAAGETTTELKYTTDGKECINKLPQGEAKGNAKYVDGKLVIDSTREAQGNELKFKETYVLSPDGKGLTINNHVSVQGQEFDITFVFTKQ